MVVTYDPSMYASNCRKFTAGPRSMHASLNAWWVATHCPPENTSATNRVRSVQNTACSLALTTLYCAEVHVTQHTCHRAHVSQSTRVTEHMCHRASAYSLHSLAECNGKAWDAKACMLYTLGMSVLTVSRIACLALKHENLDLN